MSMNQGAWKGDNTEYHPQKADTNPNFNYPDCGTNRIYPLENIEEGLRKTVAFDWDDPAETDPTQNASILSVLKGILTVLGGGASPGGVITNSKPDSITLTGGPDPLNAFTGAKKVTIINDTNNAIDITQNTGTAQIQDGYVVDLYTTDPANIEITGDSGAILNYIIYY